MPTHPISAELENASTSPMYLSSTMVNEAIWWKV